MLRLSIGGEEFFNEEDNTFSTVGATELLLEHSLLSLSKWESQTKKPFLTKEPKTPAEIRQYIEAMIISDDYPKNVVEMLSRENMMLVNAYIDSPESATTFGTMPKPSGRGETVTSELIYYWMVAFNIPFECETWHLNRLFSLIKICNIKNQPAKKRNRTEIASRNRLLNEQRKKQLGTTG